MPHSSLDAKREYNRRRQQARRSNPVLREVERLDDADRKKARRQAAAEQPQPPTNPDGSPSTDQKAWDAYLDAAVGSMKPKGPTSAATTRGRKTRGLGDAQLRDFAYDARGAHCDAERDEDPPDAWGLNLDQKPWLDEEEIV